MGKVILSLFDGIAGGKQAGVVANLDIEKYFASEIDKYAIKAAMYNHPQIIQLGDITKITNEDLDKLGKIDMIIGGSPCQDLSNYKYHVGDVTGLAGEKSGLFYHYVRVLKHVNPDFFLLENVASMEDKWRDLISEILGVQPIMIDSQLVSAAYRKRYYWTNIKGITQPNNKNITLSDIVVDQSCVSSNLWYEEDYIYNGDDNRIQCTLTRSGWHDRMKEVYNLNGKCNTILCDGDGGHRQKKVYQDGRCRRLTPVEYERLQNLPDGYTDVLSNSRRYTAIGNGWTIDVIAHIFSFLPSDWFKQ